ALRYRFQPINYREKLFARPRGGLRSAWKRNATQQRYNGSASWKAAIARSNKRIAGRSMPSRSITAAARENREYLKGRIAETTKTALSSDSYIVLDAELKCGIGKWVREWNHVRQVFAVKFEAGFEVDLLYWNDDKRDVQILRREWLRFCTNVEYVWYYA
ncbi:hypothetical protein HDU87_001010, partial [Geranomyces variabilis]